MRKRELIDGLRGVQGYNAKSSLPTARVLESSSEKNPTETILAWWALNAARHNTVTELGCNSSAGLMSHHSSPSRY